MHDRRAFLLTAGSTALTLASFGSMSSARAQITTPAPKTPRERSMSSRAIILLTIAAWMLATSVAAQASATPTTAFDGKYLGVSREPEKAGSNPGAKCGTSGVPAPLTIRNGVIGQPGTGGWEGIVTPQGTLVMQYGGSMRADGQIDSQGTITAKYSGPACIITFVWRKRSV